MRTSYELAQPSLVQHERRTEAFCGLHQDWKSQHSIACQPPACVYTWTRTAQFLICRSGAIPHLISDLELSQTPVSQEAATYALHRLGDSLETHMLMLRCEVLTHTMPLLGQASSKTQQYAASLLLALATGEKSVRRAMLPLDVFGKVFS